MKIAVLCLVALGTACQKDVTDLLPFPCPADHTCPESLACTAGTCGAPELDSDCAHGNVDCSAIGACWEGTLCEPSCASDAGQACANGRVCVADACLIDCSANDVCPMDLACHTVGAGPQKACMTPTVYVPACQSFAPRSVRECFPPCGSSLFDVPCNLGGGDCTEHSTCTTATHCMCGDGFTGITCEGMSCDTVTCNFPDWYCVWNPPAAQCTETAPGPGTCTCRNGATVDRGCVTTSCEALCDAQQSAPPP